MWDAIVELLIFTLHRGSWMGGGHPLVWAAGFWLGWMEQITMKGQTNIANYERASLVSLLLGIS